MIEDDADLRESVGSLVSTKGYRYETFDSVEAFLSSEMQSQASGCILLDFQLRGRNGLSFLEQYRDQPNAMPVVVLTAHADVPITVKFMKAGATMLLRKPYETSELLDAIEKALELNRQQLEYRSQVQHYTSCLSKLSNRQVITLQSVLDGTCNKSIASILDVSERTIEMDRADILKVFSVKNAVELAVSITKSRAAQEILSGKFLRRVDMTTAGASPHFDSERAIAAKESLKDETR